MTRDNGCLNIGYIMQADSVQMDEISGPQQHVSVIINKLRDRGHNVRLVSIQKGITQWTDNLVDYQPCRFGLSVSKPFLLVESILRGVQSRLHLPFIRLFDSYRFSDACVSHLSGFDILYERFDMLSYGALLASRRLGIPMVYELNGDLLEEYRQQDIHLSRLQWILLDLITRMMLQFADHTICVADTVYKRVINRWHIDPSKFSVIPNGADVDAFMNLHASQDARDRFNIHDDQVIIFVGGFMQWHGIDLIIEAFARISFGRPGVKLVLVGDGPVFQDMKAKVDELNLNNRVVFTGKLNHKDIASVLSIADIAVIYHRGSAADLVGAPLKLFEYMAAGRAVIAPAVPNMQLILNDRKTALLVPPDNPEALSKAFIELLDDAQLRLVIGMAARQQAIEKHSWDKTAADIESTLFRFVQK